VILVDTSVWVDHLRLGDLGLTARLEAGTVLTHPFVIGEIALGHLGQRKMVLGALADLPKATVATDAEVLTLIDALALAGRGIGYVEAHLLAAVRLTPGTVLWTRDRRLHSIAVLCGVAAAG
jgi:predicted nucleic acid-binding protein